ncbi:MAG: DNA-directed RNA polymerase subunit alpha [Candidatus Terrybacteria bacterium RIFCSPHIGHO2_01_FULL_48_17]|uniref:DNA-directed RNA polymerase subunit alpha n=1 Tax=Candidatus Terrybacteria bacterium RIFCSPHIGHO2_01_FULL_48_17 TaxID=1802362 RepID=A0A1G2PHK6_9BACT|nr:MAG: DNA-directed RNA polymerase subunit alpha [Candidatus Terrybacteria bacterium RIFCSPHIGHO2_01_FULL_48_17]OHA53546.1 MAG: DNA-directed RNA polymerase subunit alpha [Candidatus Terrybacteria bacterium RIFCSPLOWO2_01_FULL_48_14]
MARNPYIPLPSSPKITERKGNFSVFEIEPLYPGYGVTLGNALRRVLLSSLEGAAVTTVRFEQVPHEFSTIPGVQETVLDILLNLKQLRFILHGDEPQVVKIDKKGEGSVTGADIKAPSQVTVVSPAIHVAKLTDRKAALVMELTVEKGVGYVPVAVRDQLGEKLPVGTMAIDAIFSPVRMVNFEVENMRFRERTDYNRLKLTIETDGSVDPEEAFQRGVALLVQQFSSLTGIPTAGLKQSTVSASTIKKTEAVTKAAKASVSQPVSKALDGDILKQPIAMLGLPGRVGSALKSAGIQTVAGLVRRRASELLKLPGISDRAIQEIRTALGTVRLTLKE